MNKKYFTTKGVLFLLIAYVLTKHNYHINKVLHQTIADLALSLEIDQIIFVGENFYQSKIKSRKATKYNLFEDLVNISDISKLQNALILIKGSRGMALERVMDLL